MDSNGKRSVTTAGVWKVAAAIVGYLIMGVWITAQNSEATKGLRSDISDVKASISEMKTDIRHLNDRIDYHIDASRRKPDGDK